MAIPPDPTGGFGPEQAAQLLQTIHGLDPSSALLRPALAVAAIGVGIALTAGQVAARLRLTAPASVRPPGTRPTTRGEGTPQTDDRGRGRRDVVQDAADVAVAKGKPIISYWGDIFVQGAVILWHGMPKDGKTSCLTEGLAQILRGEPYLDWPTRRTSCVYFSEETAAIWKSKAGRIAGVAERAMPWWQAWMPPGPICRERRRRPSFAPKWWKRLRGYRSVFHVAGPSIGELRGVDNLVGLMLLADAEARKVGARIIVFDTLKHFCSEAQSASQHADIFINAVKGLAARGYCVIVVHHDNDNGMPLGPKSLFGGVDFRVHQSRIKGMPRTATEREVEFDGRFELGETPEPLRYRLDAQTDTFVRVGLSTGRTVPRTETDSPGKPQPLPILSPLFPEKGGSFDARGTMARTPLRLVTAPPGKDVICQKIMEELSGANDGPWTLAALVKKLVAAGVVKRAAAYAYIPKLLEDDLLVTVDGARLALKTTEKEATA